MKTIHHKVEQRNLHDLDTLKKGYISLRKISLIGKKETTQMPAVPTLFHLEEAEMALALFEQTVRTPKTMVK